MNLTLKVHSNRFTLIFLMNTQLVDIVYNNSYNVTNCFSPYSFSKLVSERPFKSLYLDLF